MTLKMRLDDEREEGRVEGIATGLAKGKAAGLAEGRAAGLAEGFENGKIQMLSELVKDNILSTQAAASRAGISEEEFRNRIQ